MFKREHHVRIATVLQSLDPKVLSHWQCYFAGGTAIVLSRDEYRESLDIDFLISKIDHYRELRHAIKSKQNLSPILRSACELKLKGDLRADQYGIRTMIDVGGVEIKFEIVFEGRMQLDKSGAKDKICGVPTITNIDMAVSKLMANSDRGADDSNFNRDLIDLAMLDLPTKKLKVAIDKAQRAYGESVLKDLKKSINNMHERFGRLNECMTALKFNSVPEAVVWKNIIKLKKA